MTSPRLAIFDDNLGRFGPLADLRAPFSITTGATNNRVRIESNVGIMATDLILDEAIAAIRRISESDARCNEPFKRAEPITIHTREPEKSWTPVTVPGDGPILLVNGRWTGEPLSLAARVRELPLGRALVQPDGHVIAAHLSCADAQTYIDSGFTLGQTPRDTWDTTVLLARPWDIIAGLEATLRADLKDTRASTGNRNHDATIARLGDHPVRVADTARVHPMTVLNSEKGPIVIGEEAIVGSFSVIAGPCFIGRHTIVQPHTHIRANTVIGDHCLVGGEISHSIILGYTNKAHAGYLGNSIVGQWCNLGADTNVSNLKNTYGSIRVQLAADQLAEDSGQTKLGPVIGDYTRTAIGSRLLTGSCLSTGTMLALSGFAPKFTPRFAFLTDEASERYDIEKFLDAARKAMARRDHKLSAAQEARLRQLAQMK